MLRRTQGCALSQLDTGATGVHEEFRRIHTSCNSWLGSAKEVRSINLACRLQDGAFVQKIKLRGPSTGPLISFFTLVRVEIYTESRKVGEFPFALLTLTGLLFMLVRLRWVGRPDIISVLQPFYSTLQTQATGRRLVGWRSRSSLSTEYGVPVRYGNFDLLTQGWCGPCELASWLHV